MKKKILPILAVLVIILSVTQCDFLYYNLLGVRTVLGDIKVAITVAGLPDTITYNLSSTPYQEVEYRWRVFIDADNDAGTGNPGGYDVEIAAWWTQVPSSFDREVTLEDFFNSAAHGALSRWNNLEFAMIGDWLNIFIEENTITLFASSIPEFDSSDIINFDPNCKCVFETLYYAPDPIGAPVTDTTTVITGNGSVDDAENDEPNIDDFDFIDIISAEIILPLIDASDE